MSDIPELRTDPITGQQVIIAPQRGHRPGAFTNRAESHSRSGEPCPFCPGNEDRTPPAVLTLPQASSDSKAGPADSWSLRVVPNLYPATFSAADTSAANAGSVGSQPNTGWHEVVIEANRHATRFTDLSVGEAEQAFLAYAYRFRAWQTNSNVRYGIAFKNNGRPAGASLEHVHSQLIGMDALPNTFVAEWKGASSYFEQHRKCVFCDLLEKDLADKTRIVDEGDDFVVVCPFASRLPYEMRIIPRTHSSHFDREPDSRIKSIGRTTHAILTRLTQLIDNIPFNYLIHTAPFDISDSPYYHWHIEIIPRIVQLAGFELGSGCHLNPVSPEHAAAQLQTF